MIFFTVFTLLINVRDVSSWTSLSGTLSTAQGHFSIRLETRAVLDHTCSGSQEGTQDGN